MKSISARLVLSILVTIAPIALASENPTGYTADCDPNKDGVVDSRDLLEIQARWHSVRRTLPLNVLQAASARVENTFRGVVRRT